MDSGQPRCARLSGMTTYGSGARLLLHRHALLLEQARELARLEHLADDVAAADELALHVELRNGRPVGEFLDALAQLVVLEHVEAFVGNAEVVEDLHDLAREPAHRELRRSLHEQHHVVRLHLVGDELVDGHRLRPCVRGGVKNPPVRTLYIAGFSPAQPRWYCRPGAYPGDSLPGT